LRKIDIHSEKVVRAF